jgi:pimeloyl-ACP methyl ester carboxylesterase
MKPIIFIPGIEATALVNTNSFDFDIVWNAYDTVGSAMFTKISGPYLEERLLKDPRYDERIESLIERNHVARLPYEKTFQNLTVKLREKQDNSPRYLFGYDWRMSNVANGERLFQFTEYIKRKIAATPHATFEGFRFITHSMGALVFSCYLNHLNNDYIDVSKAILCAPPFEGSPYALVHMIQGAGGPKSLLNSVFGRNEDIRKIVRTFPSIFELLPYYKNALTFEVSNHNVDLLNLNHWQSNIYDDIQELFQSRIASLALFRSASLFRLDTLPADVRGRMMIVAGTDDKTITELKIREEQNNIRNFVILDDKKKVKIASGDGTVPEVSSTIYSKAIKTLALPKRSFFHELADAVDYHGLFLRDSRLQNILFRFLIDNRLPARVEGNDLVALIGDEGAWWKSAGDGVVNLSPF